MTRRLLAVELLGAALREVLIPAMRRLVDWMDPSDSAVDAPPLPDERLYVPEYMTREQR